MQGTTIADRPRTTIVALSSGLLPAGVAIIRMSGPAVRDVIADLTGSVPPPRHARYGALHLGDGSKLDSGLTLFFPGPHSFTGEDCGEFHIHGGRAVVEALLRSICQTDGCRLAMAGEFTRRAFENGKMSLLDAEATADIISADTEGQRRFAVQNSDGAHARLYGAWRERLIRARAFIEAELDFSDEGDVPDAVSDGIWRDVESLRQEVAAHAAGYAKAEILRDGFDVVLIGAPNAGKSSLLNALTQREAAIVTDEPGTTRDLIEVVLDLDGIKVRLTDTAGLHETDGKVERIGIARAKERAARAGLVLLLQDLSNPREVSGVAPGAAILKVGTKSDLVADALVRNSLDHVVSSATGAGLQELLADIGHRARAAVPAEGELIPWRIRHVSLLQEAAKHLAAGTAEDVALELRSEELRLASQALGRIVGAIDVEDLLDSIFGQFCIGK
jgi:tRNA modification GTPase